MLCPHCKKLDPQRQITLGTSFCRDCDFEHMPGGHFYKEGSKCKICNKEANGVRTYTPTYTIVKYRGDNCPGCKVMQPVREEAKEHNIIKDLSFHSFKITDDNLHMIEKEKIRSIPCIIIAKDGEELARKTGVQTPVELKEWIYNACK